MMTLERNGSHSGVNVAGTSRRARVLVLSSSLLTDRMLMYSRFRERLAELADGRIWTMSARNADFQPPSVVEGCPIEPLPELRPFKEFPYNYLRRLNEMTWDYAQQTPSRLSIRKNLPQRESILVRQFRWPALLLAQLGVEQRFENWLENLCLGYPRSFEALEKFRADPPDVVITTGPHRYEEPAIIAAAKSMGIPVLAFITSWDNLSTKHRMVFKYDGFVLWSEQMEKDLHEFYAQTCGLPIYRVGAPQFDVFFNDEFRQSKEEWCAENGLRPELPVILHGLGSPNLVPGEFLAALHLARQVADGKLGDVQLVIRPHPLFETGKEAQQMLDFGPRVILQKTGQAGSKLSSRSLDRQQIVNWVNTFRHCDVLVNIFSTVSVDAAIFDKPVVNLDYDPSPRQERAGLIHDINHVWNHFKPITESGGMWMVKSNEEMVEAVGAYLKDPSLHRQKRRWIAEHVCGYIDGRCGERMAEAMVDFASQRLQQRR